MYPRPIDRDAERSLMEWTTEAKNAETVQKYWQARGKSPRVRLVREVFDRPMTRMNIRQIWAVRSDMIGGLPR